MTGIQIGRILGLIIFPLLIMAIVGLITYLRFKDKARAKKAAFSWWSITLGIVLLVLGLIGQMANTTA